MSEKQERFRAFLHSDTAFSVRCHSCERPLPGVSTNDFGAAKVVEEGVANGIPSNWDGRPFEYYVVELPPGSTGCEGCGGRSFRLLLLPEVQILTLIGSQMIAGKHVVPKGAKVISGTVRSNSVLFDPARVEIVLRFQFSDDRTQDSAATIAPHRGGQPAEWKVKVPPGAVGFSIVDVRLRRV